MRIRAPSRNTAIYIVLIAVAVGVWDMARKSKLNCAVDWDSAPRLLQKPIGPLPDIAEVRVVVTGPRKSFDSYRSVPSLLRLRPIIQSPYVGIIEEVVQDLRDDLHAQFLNTSGEGYTYHVLLLEQDTKKAMHFRIFAPSLDYEGPAMVYPRSEAGLAYVNGKILRRLRQLAVEESSGKK